MRNQPLSSIDTIVLLCLRNSSRQPYGILVAHEVFQAILVAEKLPFAKRHEPARPDHTVFEYDSINSQVELSVTVRAAYRRGFLLVHANANESAVK